MEQTALDAWLTTLATVPPWDELLAVDADERARRGYGDTLREICQQPLLWSDSADRVFARADAIRRHMQRERDSSPRPIVGTGSGSSEYAAACVAPVLQEGLGTVARAVASGAILTYPAAYLTKSDPSLVISFARSGESPESAAVLELLLREYPEARHLALTCNANGRLATTYASDPRVLPLVLDPRTNDRSLVMTSSFTNMVVAGQALAAFDDEGAYRRRVDALCDVARDVLQRHASGLAAFARTQFTTACFLGAGAHFGAAREAALKTLEMSAGEVSTLVETPLGLRHGPLAALRDETLVVVSLPVSRTARAYVMDVLSEVGAKRPSAPRLIIGDALPQNLLTAHDIQLDLPGYSDLGDGLSAVITVLVGQVLAFFRCMAGGLRPDAPSPAGVISRVVPQFQIHR